ncbi:MAG: M20/M25/M40 family metallo-hydrolase [Pirellulaceae bacterium]|nr:M20/M25/M40 family metallo-hydrolase [Pirellulaceae bacterium]
MAAGNILLTAHDLHESPWGDGSQVDQLIRDGFVGDAVMLPEYNSDRLNVVGRGLAILEVILRREGEPVHEVLGGSEQPDVIAAGADLVRRLRELDTELSEIRDPLAGSESLFVGTIASGEIYNQSPTEFSLSGTRRWLPGTDYQHVLSQLEELFAAIGNLHQVTPDATIHFVRDGYRVDTSHPVVAAFQEAARSVMGQPLPEGCKPFVDDGNTFAAIAGIPAITHGPNARGAHTTQEEVPLAELERVALVYAMTAAGFCRPEP